MPADSPPDAALALYRLPPGEFTAARGQLAKDLRAAGDKETADLVKGLRRPANAAWALNQVAGADGALIDGVLEAGSALRAASAAGERDAIVAATRAERAARESTADAAMAALRDADLPASDTVRRQVLDTLHAALVDDDVAAALQQGTLAEPHTSSGFDLSLSVAPARPARPRPTPPARGPKPKPKPAEQAEERARAEAEKQEAARAARVAEAHRRKHEAEVAKAEEKATRLERLADEAESRAEKARADATKARAELETLNSRK